MQNRDRFPPQTIRHVLDRPRRQLHHHPPLLPPQWPLRGLLGGPPRGLSSTFVSHTQEAADRNCNWFQKEIRVGHVGTPGAPDTEIVALRPGGGLGLTAEA